MPEPWVWRHFHENTFWFFHHLSQGPFQGHHTWTWLPTWCKKPNTILVSRHVILPQDIARLVPKSHLMTETEWRNLGVQQSPGWLHFMVHNPEPHVLLFRRPRTDNQTPVNGLDSTNSNTAVKVWHFKVLTFCF